MAGRTSIIGYERLAKMLDSRVQQYCEIILSLVCREVGGLQSQVSNSV